MHKTSYASGFLYHLPSQQILLQQKTPTTSTHSAPWSLFTSPYSENEDPKEIFKNIIFDLLHIKIDTVHLVYSYFNENTSMNHVIVYAELNDLQNFSKNGITYAWFSFRDVTKLNIAEQTKHDIVIAQRVIDDAARKNRDVV